MEQSHIQAKKSNKLIIAFSSLVLTGIVLFGLYSYYVQAPLYSSDLVHQEIQQVAQLLEKIDKTCTIINIRPGHNKIDFLHVIAFAGSEIGPLNLEYPKKWQGPYVQDNPTFSGKLYELVTTNNGYFVIPGVGARLPNGLVMGADIKITVASDIAAMTLPGGALHYDGYAFAHKLRFALNESLTTKMSQLSAVHDISVICTQAPAEALPEELLVQAI